MNLEEFKKIIEYRSLSVSYDKISEITGLKVWEFRKVSKLSLDEFKALDGKHVKVLDRYENYILKNTIVLVIYLKNEERFGVFFR